MYVIGAASSKKFGKVLIYTVPCKIVTCSSKCLM